jgi:hypothetical protein
MLHTDVAAVMALAALLRPQLPLPTPPPLTDPTSDARPATVEETYHKARPADLQDVAMNGETYQRRNVIVRGNLEPLPPGGQYLALVEAGARLMVIPLEGDDREFLSLMGRDVELTGIVRVLPKSQGKVPCRGERLLESLCDDPLLPVLPNARPDWPRVSITAIKVVDHGSGEIARRDGARAPADTGLEAAAADGKPVTAVGQFRGANLCRDLPDAGRRDVRDWVLLTSEGPVWVTGRPPEGRGFRLNPAYRGDIGRWLEVTGRVSVAGEVRFLRAGNVALIARPPVAELLPCAP